MKKPFYSIIIPVYNVEEYLAECLESVYSQNFYDYEIIAVNDGSTDSSLYILEEYKNKYGKMHIYSQENRGLSAARNVGLKMASGKWICFLDSDDVWMPSLLSIVFEKCYDDIDMVSYEHVMVYDKHDMHTLKIQKSTGQENIEVTEGTGWEIFGWHIDNENYHNNVWRICFRKEFLDKISISFVEGEYYEDVLFSLKSYIMASKVTHIHKTLYLYRQRKGSIMALRNNQKIMDDYISVIQQMIEFIGDCSLPEWVEEKTIFVVKQVVNDMDKNILCMNQYEMSQKAKRQSVYELYKALRIYDRKYAFQKDIYLLGLEKILSESDRYIIYGAGGVGLALGRYLREKGMLHKVITYCVTNVEQVLSIEGVSVRSIEELSCYPKDILVIIAAASAAPEMEKVLQKAGYNNYIVIDKYLEISINEWLVTN